MITIKLEINADAKYWRNRSRSPRFGFGGK